MCVVGSGTQGLPEETFRGCELLEGRAHVLPLSRPLSSTNFRSGRQDQHPELGVLSGTEKFLLMAAPGLPGGSGIRPGPYRLGPESSVLLAAHLGW